MKSSYIQNNYAEVFESIITAWRPRLCVELGVLDGYSTIAIGKALVKLGNAPFNTPSHLTAYDLFEDYPYNHGVLQEVEKRILENGLSEVVTLRKGDAYEAHLNYEDNSVSLLHVDLSNTGEVVRKIISLWNSKIVVGGIILIEGGTVERDKVEYMVKYAKEPIKPEIESNAIIQAKYVYGTYLKFPGLTFLLKKRE